MVPVFETPSGSINGANRDYYTSGDYRSGTVRMFRNGVLQRKDLVDGWDEMGGKRVRMKEAPETGGVVRVYYIPIL